jgi:hypothetical protein
MPGELSKVISTATKALDAIGGARTSETAKITHEVYDLFFAGIASLLPGAAAAGVDFVRGVVTAFDEATEKELEVGGQTLNEVLKTAAAALRTLETSIAQCELATRNMIAEKIEETRDRGGSNYDIPTPPTAGSKLDVDVDPVSDAASKYLPKIAELVESVADSNLTCFMQAFWLVARSSALTLLGRVARSRC